MERKVERGEEIKEKRSVNQEEANQDSVHTTHWDDILNGTQNLLQVSNFMGHGNITIDKTMEADHSIGVGAGGGGKGKKKCSASSSKSVASRSTVRLTPTDDNWPKDIPSTYNYHRKNFNDILRDAMQQGCFDLCWAVAIARCMEALIFLKDRIRVKLSPQHLVNNIKNKGDGSGKLTKYNEVRKFLKEKGLVLEEKCPYSGKIKSTCPISCKRCDEVGFKIKDLVYMKQKQVNEEDLIKIVNGGTVLAVVEAYTSFVEYKDGIYEGRTNKKDEFKGRHVVVVSGFDTTPEGINYWEIQNSWGTSWGQNGFGKIIRKSTRGANKPSLFIKIIILKV